MPRLLLVPLLVSVAVLAFGCGENGTPPVPHVERSIVLTRDRVDFALERITRAQSRDELLGRMDEAADTIDDAARDLEGVGTPKNYERRSASSSTAAPAVDVQATPTRSVNRASRSDQKALSLRVGRGESSACELARTELRSAAWH
jgi:hypothetical protein